MKTITWFGKEREVTLVAHERGLEVYYYALPSRGPALLEVSNGRTYLVIDASSLEFRIGRVAVLDWYEGPDAHAARAWLIEVLTDHVARLKSMRDAGSRISRYEARVSVCNKAVAQLRDLQEKA